MEESVVVDLQQKKVSFLTSNFKFLEAELHVSPNLFVNTFFKIYWYQGWIPMFNI